MRSSPFSFRAGRFEMASANELRHPASASCLGRHLRLAGRCPNNSSLLPPLAAVVVVALWPSSEERLFLICNSGKSAELVGAKPLHLLTQTALPLKSPTGAFIATQTRIFQNCPFTRNRFQYGLDCIYTTGNENVCGKYRKMAEILCAALHFAAESIKV